MRLHVKVGTMPAEYADALRLRNPPKVGQTILLKRHWSWQSLARAHVIVEKIKDLGGELLYFVSLH